MVVAGQAVVVQLVVGACLLRLPMDVLIAAAKFKRDKFCSVSMVHEPDEDSTTVRSATLFPAFPPAPRRVVLRSLITALTDHSATHVTPRVAIILL